MTATGEDLLSWHQLDAGDLDGRETVVDDICSRRIDGVTIADVMSAEETARAVAALRGDGRDDRQAMFGSMVGLPLAELPRHTEDTTDRSVYLDDAARNAEVLGAAFGFDPAQRVFDVVSRLVAGRTVTSPAEGERRYSAGNVRFYEPGSVGLPAHAGNEFHMHGDGTLAHLRSTTATTDHMSWFVILQQPDEGGELAVFDRTIETYTASGPWTDQGRQDEEFDAIPALRVDPAPGSMVLFGGGWRWHRVEPVTGTVARATYGGFAGISHDGGAVNLWF